MKLVIKRSMNAKWYVILIANNGRTLMTSEMYNTKQAAIKACHAITRHTGEHALTYEDHSKNSMVMAALIIAAVLGIAAPAMAREAVVTTEWHPASWVQGGYDDHDTIVTSKLAAKPVFVRGGEAPRPAMEAPKPHKSVLVPAIDYPERITYPEPKEEKRSGLRGPSMGFHKGEDPFIYTHRAGSHVVTKRYKPNRTVWG